MTSKDAASKRTQVTFAAAEQSGKRLYNAGVTALCNIWLAVSDSIYVDSFILSINAKPGDGIFIYRVEM